MTSQQHRQASTVWAFGDYARLTRDVLSPLGEVLADATGVGPGKRVLDVATGTGNAALAAARRGATVTGVDITPELLDAARVAASSEGLDIAWDRGDAADLRYPDASFDVVLSSIGVAFAADHERAAAELVRVCRPGGTIGLANWTADGTIRDFFAVLARHAPPPPGPSPLRWGEEGEVRALLGERVIDLRTEPGTLVVDHFENAAEYVRYYRATFGPTIAAFEAVRRDTDRCAALERDFLAFAERHDVGANGRAEYRYEYVVTVGRVERGGIGRAVSS